MARYLARRNQKKVFSASLFLLCLMSLICSTAYAGNYRIASGSEGGGYHSFVKKMTIDGKISSDENFTEIKSSGSIENLSLLQDGIADFAILQQNIATKAYFNEVEPYKNFEIISALYPEIVQIIVYGKNLRKNEKVTLSKIINYIQEEEIKIIYVDGIGTASHIFIKRLLALNGIGSTSLQYSVFNESRSNSDCQKICLTVQISKFPISTKQLDQKIYERRFVQLTIEEYFSLEDKLKGFNLFKISYLGREWFALGTWSVFVAGHTVSLDKHDKVKQIIKRYIIEERPSTLTNEFIEVAEVHPNGGLKIFSIYQYAKNAVFDSLPKAAVDKVAKKVYFYLLLLAVIILFVMRIKHINIKYIWYRYNHFIFSVVFLVVIFGVAGWFILNGEKQIGNETGFVSTIATYSLLNIYEWLVKFSFAGYDSGVFPVSVSGQRISVLSHFAGIGAALFSVGAEILFMRKQKKRIEGDISVDYKNHIVICGGNEQLPKFIENIISGHSDYGMTAPKIVIIYPQFQDLLVGSKMLKDLHELGRIEYIKGAVRDETTLVSSNISEAKVVYLLSEDKTHVSDEKTLLRALSISRFCRKINGEPNKDSIYMVAEVSNDDFSDSLRKADVNEVINTSSLSENLLVQSTLNPGLSGIINSLLKIDDGHEFYTISLPENSFLIGKVYDDLIIELRRKNILLIGIKVNVPNKNNLKVIDASEITSYLVSLNLKRQVLTNPDTPSEIRYKVKLYDDLIVLAESWDVVKAFAN